MERKSLFGKKPSGGGNRPEAFAFEVLSYDTKSRPAVVKGRRLNDNKEVTVYLRDIEMKAGSRYKRSEIADFAAPRKSNNHPGTTVGGILLAQEAFPQGNDVYAARWLQSLSHTPGEAEVFTVMAHVSPVRNSSKGKPFSIMTLLHDGDFSAVSDEMADLLNYTPPFSVSSSSELRDALTQMLGDGLSAGVRVHNEAGEFDAQYLSQNTRDLDIEGAVNKFMQGLSEVTGAIDAGDLKCEVIPFSNIWAGKATTDIMAKSARSQAQLGRYNTEVSGPKGTHTVSVFRPTIVAARITSADGEGKRAAYFSSFEPLYTQQPVPGLVNAIAYAKTDLLSPEPPRPDSSPAPAAAQPAGAPAGERNAAPADDGDSFAGDQSFDGGSDDAPVDDDLMAAAGFNSGPGELDAIPSLEPQPEPEEVKPEPSRARRYTRR